METTQINKADTHLSLFGDYQKELLVIWEDCAARFKLSISTEVKFCYRCGRPIEFSSGVVNRFGKLIPLDPDGIAHWHIFPTDPAL